MITQDDISAAEHVPVLIIGAGPAGYTAGIYASRAGLDPMLYTGIQPGGQLTTTTEVENFPGYPAGVQGPTMMHDLHLQATRFGTVIRYATITEVSLEQNAVKDEIGIVVTYDALIIATGSTPKLLGIPDEQKYWGQGVSTCATCDGFFYKGKDVGIVGGGDTACEEALYLSNICRQVYMIVRGKTLRASTIMQERVKDKPNISVVYEAKVDGMSGENGLDHVRLDVAGTMEHLLITGLFIAIGNTPNSQLFKGQLFTDGNGYLTTFGKGQATSRPNVFVAGDVADPHYRQAVTSAGSGCKAALDAERYLALKS